MENNPWFNVTNINTGHPNNVNDQSKEKQINERVEMFNSIYEG